MNHGLCIAVDVFLSLEHYRCLLIKDCFLPDQELWHFHNAIALLTACVHWFNPYPGYS